MIDFAYLMDAFREAPASLIDIAVKLAAAPCSPLGMRSPDAVVLHVLNGRRSAT